MAVKIKNDIPGNGGEARRGDVVVVKLRMYLSRGDEVTAEYPESPRTVIDPGKRETIAKDLATDTACITTSPTANLDYLTEYYVVIDATAVIDTTGGDAFAGFSAPPASANWSFTVIPPPATITLLNTANFATPSTYTSEAAPRTYSLAFDPDDTADALVVIFATESGSPSASVTWDGVPMTQVFPLSGNNPVGVYFLNNPTNLGLANVNVTISSASSVNGLGFSVMALSNPGNLPIAPTAYRVQTGAAAAANIPLVVPTHASLVVAGFSSGDSSNGGSITTSANLTLLQRGDFGSVQGCFAYDADVAAGSNNYQFSFTGTPAFATAVAFAVEIPFADWIADPAYGIAPADRNLNDDPDGDGIDNGVENFFGTNPGVFTQGLAAGIRSGNTFTFTHPQGTAASDLSANYRWSTDLATFHLGGATSDGTTVTFTTEANTPSPGFTRVTATATGTVPDRLFVDVWVTGP